MDKHTNCCPFFYFYSDSCCRRLIRRLYAIDETRILNSYITNNGKLVIISDTKSGGEIAVPIIIRIKYANRRDFLKNAGDTIPILVKKSIMTGKSKKNAKGTTKLNKKLK
jgi:hypothetical protein